ncbi:Endoribonuclease L-PSP/chorismate mutase-like protein [Aspergillus pseudotamarii]|uniref:Endoribonuclease L-PSP/chorismate mutase-like protein n=1 Tax=Aspergillus pseudotamarii TaxID=132259 RepID=A0A5N6SW78_ASPPS|nr:Endoribonuclease L-PSP/chorismate mutase-like protein [Aspergillus pseudotamarii]KAE8137990.1 Endoribonuclease L-PSP/chorismate mutase-like protein [Aspergillus pseudotamarii]
MAIHRSILKTWQLGTRTFNRPNIFIAGHLTRSFSSTRQLSEAGKITTHHGQNCSPPRAGVPYSPAAKANGLVWVSGQVAADATGKYLDNGLSVTEKSHRMMQNVKAVLEGAGSSLDKVVKANIIFTKIDDDYEEFNEVYKQYITHNPARTSVEVSGLPKPADIEIEVVALA